MRIRIYEVATVGSLAARYPAVLREQAEQGTFVALAQVGASYSYIVTFADMSLENRFTLKLDTVAPTSLVISHQAIPFRIIERYLLALTN